MKTFCEYFNQSLCHSCKSLPENYLDQLSTKEKILTNKLNISNELLLPTFPSPIKGFRNKVKLSVGKSGEDIVFGLVDKEFNGTDLSLCPIQRPEINKMLDPIRTFIKLSKIEVYSPLTQKGELKNLIIYYNHHSQQSYLRFVLRSKEAHSRISKHIKTLHSEIEHLKVVAINIQPSPHPILEGNEEIIISSQKHLIQKVGNIEYELSTQGFVQTNLDVSLGLYSTASEWIKELNSNKFLEIFSGQGAFSFFVAKDVKLAKGFEINQSAVDSANLTAQKYQLDHLSFKCLDAKDIEEEVKKYNPDVILANPPRRGLAESIQIINESQSEYFIYSSCNFETLSSDILALTNYKIIKAKIFDMFAHTEHFETLVLLKKVI